MSQYYVTETIHPRADYPPVEGWLTVVIPAPAAAADRRLLETGAVRLTEDGGERVLETFVVFDAAVSIPPVEQLLQRYIRTGEREYLDVTKYDWVQPAWITAAGKHLPLEADIWPAIEQEIRSFLPPRRKPLETRNKEWVQPGWVTAAGAHLPLDPQLWPAIDLLLGVFRSRSRPSLDLRIQSWVQSAWITEGIPAPTFDDALWPAIEQLLRTFRSEDVGKIDMRGRTQPQPAWITAAGGHLPFSSEQWAAIKQLTESVRSRSGVLPVRGSEHNVDWITKLLEAPFDPVTFAAVVQLMDSFRSRDVAQLDVRAFTVQEAAFIIQAIDVLGSNVFHPVFHAVLADVFDKVFPDVRR